MTKWMRIAALAILPLMAACSDDQGPVDNADPAKDIATIRLTIGSETVDIGQSGASRSIDIPRGTTSISATFHRASGTPITLPSGYSVQFVSTNPGRLTFTRTGDYGGTLSGLSTGTVLLTVSLLHGSHADFGPHNVTINVLPATDG